MNEINCISVRVCVWFLYTLSHVRSTYDDNQCKYADDDDDGLFYWSGTFVVEMMGS